jgi:hypothetical protein
MKHFEILVLLQHLAEKLDTGGGTQLEQRSFDCIMEILNENIKTRCASNQPVVGGNPGHWNISSNNPS